MDIPTHLQQHDRLETDPFRSANRAGLPYGSWLSDTFNGADIYAMGFDKRPTVFFDPSATSSLGWGTYKQPFKNNTELNAWITGKSGALTGQVLGFKRGSTFRGTWQTPTGGIYGTSAAPFYIVPYGDAEAMPVLTSGSVFTSTEWVAAAANSAIYRIGLLANLGATTECDVFDQSYSGTIKRFIKQDPTALTTDADICAALVSAGRGTSVYKSVGGTVYLYIYPFASGPDFTKIEIMAATKTLYIQYKDVATSGYITLAGLDVRGGNNNSAGTWIISAGVASMTSAPGIQVIGCRIGQSSFNGMTFYGADTVRLTTAEVIGNYFYDCFHNPLETGAVTSMDIWGNRTYHNGSMAYELWALCSGVKIHDNYVEYVPSIVYGVALSSSIYSFAKSTLAGGAADATLSVGNSYYRNILLNNNTNISGTVGIGHIGQDGICYDNTVVSNNGNSQTVVSCLADVAGNVHTSLTLRNNNLIGTNAGGGNSIHVSDTATAKAETGAGGKNNMWSPTGTQYAKWHGSAYTLTANYNTASGGTATNTNPNFTSDGYTPQAASLFNAGDVIATYTERDWIGRPMLANGTDTLPAIGAVARP